MSETQMRTVERDLSCVRCGYNLRTLPTAGRCPECGAAVALTMELGDAFARSRPGYVARLALGSWWLFAVRFACTVAVLAATPFVSGGARGLLIFALGLIGYAIGCWLITAREHPRMPPELPWTVGLLRIAAVFLLVGGVLLGAIWLRGLIRTDYSAIALPAWLIYGVCPILETRLLLRLTYRLSDERLREHAWIAGVGATASTLLPVWILAVAPRGGPGLWTLLALLVALLLFWLWMGYVSYLAARSLTRAKRLASMRWNDDLHATETQSPQT